MNLEKNFNLKLEVDGIDITEDNMVVHLSSTGDLLSQSNKTEPNQPVYIIAIVMRALNEVGSYQGIVVPYIPHITHISSIRELELFFDKDIDFYKEIQPMILEFAKANKIPNSVMGYCSYSSDILHGILKDIGSGITSGIKLEGDPNLTIKWNVNYAKNSMTLENMHFSKEYNLCTSRIENDVTICYEHFAKSWNDNIIGKYDWSLIL